MLGQNLSNEELNALQNAQVVDETGDKVGKVGQIYLDDQSSRPTWVTVQTGLFGAKETFVPLDEASREGDDVIRVPYSKDFIKDAPKVDADQHISENEEDELYRYYGLTQGAASDRSGEVRDTDRTTQTAGTAGAAGAAGGVDHDRRDADTHTDVDRDRSAGGESVVRHEEQLHAGTERVQTGRVRLRKHVVSGTETVEVPVEREEVEIVREPVSGNVEGDTGKLGDDEVVVETHGERAVVNKETVAKERVGVQKDTVQDTERVTEEVRKEEVDVVRDGDDVNRDDVNREGENRR